MRAAPRFNYGSDPHDISVVPDGVLFTSSELSLYLGSTEPLAIDQRDAVHEFTLEEGGIRRLLLGGSRFFHRPTGLPGG